MKQRLITMASENIQILQHPNYTKDATVNSAKERFRIEFEGILACLDLDWDSWEDDYLFPSRNSCAIFADECARRIVELREDKASAKKVDDVKMMERMQKMNRYGDEIGKKGRLLGREVRSLVSEVNMAGMQRELEGEEGVLMEENDDKMEDDEVAAWEGGPSKDFNFGSFEQKPFGRGPEGDEEDRSGCGVAQ